MAERARVAILISGRGSNMAALLYAAKREECPYEVVLVASNNPEARGLAVAAAEGIPTFAHSHKDMEREAFDAIMHDALREANAEYVVLAGYMRILSTEFVEKWDGRMLNIHPSLLVFITRSYKSGMKMNWTYTIQNTCRVNTIGVKPDGNFIIHCK